MKDIVKNFDNLPLILKLIVALPGLDIIWNIVRVCRSLAKNNTVNAVIAVILIFVGIPFVWLIDILFILFKGNIWWLD